MSLAKPAPNKSPIPNPGVQAMNIDRAMLAFAGTLILISVLLTHFVSPWWLLLTTFVGLNLLQSAFTGFCPAAIVMGKLGLKPGCAFGQATR